MKNIARVLATTALVGAAVLTAGGAASANSIDWPVPPVTAPGQTAAPAADPAAGPAVSRIDWP